MTPKEKADELFNKYDNYPLTYEWKKQCALIAVDEILKITWVDKFLITEDYWQEVKQEIEKL
jgi:hypothetical protein